MLLVAHALAVVIQAASSYSCRRPPDPWAWPDWSYAAADGTFGNRYDDPDGSYRVPYASSQRIGACLETLACFRPDLEVLAELDRIVAAGADAECPAGGWRDVSSVTVSDVRASTVGKSGSRSHL
jgi:hypothetical protein